MHACMWVLHARPLPKQAAAMDDSRPWLPGMLLVGQGKAADMHT